MSCLFPVVCTVSVCVPGWKRPHDLLRDPGRALVQLISSRKEKNCGSLKRNPIYSSILLLLYSSEFIILPNLQLLIEMAEMSLSNDITVEMYC